MVTTRFGKSKAKTYSPSCVAGIEFATLFETGASQPMWYAPCGSNDPLPEVT